MIHMGSRTSGHDAGKIPGSYRVGSGTANTDHRLNPINNLTGAHVTDPTTGSAGAKQAGRHAAVFNTVIGSANLLGKVLIEQVNGRATGYIITAFASTGFGHNMIS
jgi:hypothetical protein